MSEPFKLVEVIHLEFHEAEIDKFPFGKMSDIFFENFEDGLYFHVAGFMICFYILHNEEPKHSVEHLAGWIEGYVSALIGAR